MQYCEAVFLQLKINKFEAGKETKMCVCVCVCVCVLLCFVLFWMLSVSSKAENKKGRSIPEQKCNKNRDTEA